VRRKLECQLTLLVGQPPLGQLVWGDEPKSLDPLSADRGSAEEFGLESTPSHPSSGRASMQA
jgi:hypothetical protein